MFKKLVLVMAVMTGTAYAEMVTKPVFCGSPEAIHKTIDSYGERALLGAATDLPNLEGNLVGKATIILYVNAEKNTFTVVEYLTPKEACIVHIGGNIVFDGQKVEQKRDMWLNESRTNL